eukprot:8123108-Alexandrium_andersonii.AAC.1
MVAVMLEVSRPPVGSSIVSGGAQGYLDGALDVVLDNVDELDWRCVLEPVVDYDESPGKPVGPVVCPAYSGPGAVSGDGGSGKPATHHAPDLARRSAREADCP